MNIRKVASYLPVLSKSEYQLPNMVDGVVNYFLDSYFLKIDERNKNAQEPIPHDLNTYLKESWLNCEIHTAINLNQIYPTYSRALTAYAFSRLFTQWSGPQATYEIVPYLDNFKYKDYIKSEYQIKQSQLEVGLNQQEMLPVYGTFFVKNRITGAHLIVDLDLCYYSSQCKISVTAHSHAQAEALGLIADLDTSRMINDIYKNQCLIFDQGYLGFCSVIPTDWDQIILKDHIVAQIKKNSIGVLNHIENLTSIGMPAHQSILLISPPGMAKTTIFRATSNSVTNATRIWCTGKSIEYTEHVTAMFQAARDLAPSILFIEDMDLFGGDRSSSSSNSYILNEFLTQLDGTQSNTGVVIMASTNDIDSMDEALINRPGRFGSKIEIPLPDEEDRQEMLVSFFKAWNARPASQISNDIWESIIKMTEGFTGDYLKALVKEVILKATAEGRCVNGQVQFISDDLTVAGESMMRNFQIGKRAKKHHQYKMELETQ